MREHSPQIAEDHPIQRVLCFLEQDFDENDVDAVYEAVTQLASSRDWVIGPPQFVNEADPTPVLPPDEPAWTLGVLLDIYSEFPPWPLPPELSRKHYDEVSALVDAVRQLSAKKSLVLLLQIDDDLVGGIENGVVDQTITMGLLAKWRGRLEEQRSAE